MIAVVLAILLALAVALVVVACYPRWVKWLVRDDEADHDPYNFWGKREWSADVEDDDNF